MSNELHEGAITSRDYLSLREEMSLLRQALAVLTAEVTVLRVSQASLTERIGRPGYATLVAGVIIALSITGSVVGMTYWGGQVAARVEASVAAMSEFRANLSDHLKQERRKAAKEDWE